MLLFVELLYYSYRKRESTLIENLETKYSSCRSRSRWHNYNLGSPPLKTYTKAYRRYLT